MADLVLISAAWAAVSAVAVAALGIVSLTGGRARPPGALPFGLFALLWGIQIVLVNVAGFASSAAMAQRLYLLSQACVLPLAYFLLEFTAAHVAGGRRRLRWGGLRAAGALAAVAGAGVLVLSPRSLFAGVRLTDGIYHARWGDWIGPVVGLPHFVAFGIAIFALNLAMRRAPTPRTKERLATLVAGLGLYVAFTGASNAVIYATALAEGLEWTSVSFFAVFLFMTVISAGIGLASLAAARHPRVPTNRRREQFLAAALLVPLSWGFVEGVLALGPATNLNTVGLWRLAGVGVIAYGLARWRLFDLPQRLRRTASSATGAAGAVATGATVYGASSLVFTGIILPVATGALTVALALVPGLRVARRLFGLDQRVNPIDYESLLYEQRIDSYRAALEASLARGSLEEDEPFLLALRERYAITDDEDRVVRYYARSSVVVARDGDVAAAYDRLRILGEGGGGRTWLARDRARDRLVVIKEPLAHWQKDPELREAVRQEAQVAAKVRHPNVVAVEEVVEQDGLPYIVMEFMDGGSLADLLRARGVLPWRDAFALLHDVLSGLDAVHQRGIVHRDIKPSNVLLTSEGVAKVSDFGIAVVASPSGATQIEATEGRAGTLAYMPPEVVGGRSAGGTRADVYACAAVLHECLYGTPVGTDGAVVADNDVPPKVEAILARGLAADPMRRFPSARAFADELVKVSKE